MTPRILGQTRQVAVRFSVSGSRRWRYQGFQTLIGGGVAKMVQLVEMQGAFQGANVLPGLHHPGLVGVVHYRGYDDGRQDRENYHHHHDLNEGEPCRDGARGGRAVHDSLHHLVHVEDGKQDGQYDHKHQNAHDQHQQRFEQFHRGLDANGQFGFQLIGGPFQHAW